MEDLFCYEGKETPNYIYDKNIDSFKLNKNHGGQDLESVETYVGIEKIKCDLDKNIVTLSVKKLYKFIFELGPNGTCFYSNRNDAFNDKNEIKKFDRKTICDYNSDAKIYICEPSKVYNEVKNNLQEFNYMFENQNGRFILKSISK